MAQPTLAAFDYTDPSEFSLWVGTYTTGSTGLMNQIETVSGQVRKDRPEQTIKRMGDTVGTIIYGTPTYNSSLAIGLIDASSSADYAAITGDSASPYDIATTASLTITIGHHVTAGGNLDYYWQCTGFEVNDSGFDIDGNSTPTKNTINLVSKERWQRYTVS